MSATDELVDRVALRDLVNAYAHGVDRRQPQAVAELFTADGRLEMYDGDPDKVEPVRARHGREEIATALAGLSRYEMTTHFVGQQSVTLHGDRATGETYCIAHHISADDGSGRHDHVLSIRYLDDYLRVDGAWRIERRRLAIDWSDERTLETA